MAPKKSAPTATDTEEKTEKPAEKAAPKTAKKDAAPAAKAMSPLERARQELKKVLDEDHSVPMDMDMLRTPMPHITTGSVTVDYLIGGHPNQFGVAPCPGWPRGKINNLYGASGAGKTTLALTTAARVCEAGGTVCYIDWENEVVPAWAAALGVPIHDRNRFDLQQPNTLEDGMKIMLLMASSGVDLIVVDSVGAGVPQEFYNADIKEEGAQGRMGLVAAKWSKFLPRFKQLVKDSGTTVIGISQLRKTMNSMGGPTEAPQGGEAWKFYSAIRMMLRVFSKQKTKRMDGMTGKMTEMVTGALVIAKLDKCKVGASAHQEQMFYLKSGTGIDNSRTIVDLAVNYGVITKRGSWHDWHTGPKGLITGNGIEQFMAKLQEDPANLNILFSQVSPKIGGGSAPLLIPGEADAESEGDGVAAEDLEDLFAMVPGMEKIKAAAPETDPDLG